MKEFLIYLLYRRAKRSKEKLLSNAAMFDAFIVLLLLCFLMFSTTIWVLRKGQVSMEFFYDEMDSKGKRIFIFLMLGLVMVPIWVWYRRNISQIRERFAYYASLPNGMDKRLQSYVYALYVFVAFYCVLGTLFISMH